MTTIWERIYDALEGLNLPMADSVYRAETDDSLPDEFIVFAEISSDPAQHADDDEKYRRHHVQVTYHNRAGLQSMPDIAGSMVTGGFTKGPTRELPYEEESEHYSLALEFWYSENQ